MNSRIKGICTEKEYAERAVDARGSRKYARLCKNVQDTAEIPCKSRESLLLRICIAVGK